MSRIVALVHDLFFKYFLINIVIGWEISLDVLSMNMYACAVAYDNYELLAFTHTYVSVNYRAR